MQRPSTTGHQSVGSCNAGHEITQRALAHAVVHLSLAPKSRAVTSAVWAAVEDVREGRTGEVPPIGPSTTSFRPLGRPDLSYYREDDV